jgi:hypothetical protein
MISNLKNSVEVIFVHFFFIWFQVKRYFEYEEPDGTVNEIWRQVSKKLPLIKLMINREKRLFAKQAECSCVCTNQTAISNL